MIRPPSAMCSQASWDVAVLAGVSPTRYTYLEQARAIRPSPGLLDSLAVALRLSEAERRYMHVLAYGHQPTGQTALPGDDGIGELIGAFGATPCPVYAFDDVTDVVACNDAAVEWYADFGSGQRNVLEWLLMAPEARERLVDWEHDCRDIIARYRTFVAALHTNPRISRYIAELLGRSPEFAQWWDEHEVRPQVRRSCVRRHPRYGVRRMVIHILRPADRDDVQVAFHVPADLTTPR